MSFEFLFYFIYLLYFTIKLKLDLILFHTIYLEFETESNY